MRDSGGEGQIVEADGGKQSREPLEATAGAVASSEDLARGHALRVAHCFPEGHPGRAVGLFHDFIEDGEGTEADVRTWLEPEVADAVVALTRREDETYADYIERVAQSGPLAVAVKRADLLDNLARMDSAHETLRPRYERALRRLSTDDCDSGRPQDSAVVRLGEQTNE